MKKLIFITFLFITANGFCQGEYLYSDVTDTDQDGNTFEWINYGTRDWSIENADVSTYRDGTLIPQVTDAYEWENLTTGAWCYYYNNPSNPKLYNWYAVKGIHDNDPNTPNKEFAPDGWRVPSVYDWNDLIDYLIDNGYNFDIPNSQDNFIGESMATPNPANPIDSENFGWWNSNYFGTPGHACSTTNNGSGFNAIASGKRLYNAFSTSTNTYSGFGGKWKYAWFWTSTESTINNDIASWRSLSYSNRNLASGGTSTFFYKKNGYSVRFTRTAQTANININAVNDFKIIPNPATDYLFVDNLDVKNAIIYNILGKEIMKVNDENKIDVSSLSKGVYFIRVSDGINSSIKKFIKK
tara:strand:+ start:2809 stop:3870 length:1062 start_codon:yes stop_codon:yes gene_type:complete